MDSQKKADSLRFLFLHTKRTRPFQAGPFVARHINNWFKKDTLEYHYQKHLILLFAIHCMRMFCRHDDGFAFVEFVFYAVDGDFTGSVEAGDEGVAAGLVGADFFAFVEGK